MDKNILVYITSDKDRVIGGDPLTLLVQEKKDKKELAAELGRTLRTDVVQLRNGDYILID